VGQFYSDEVGQYYSGANRSQRLGPMPADPSTVGRTGRLESCHGGNVYHEVPNRPSASSAKAAVTRSASCPAETDPLGRKKPRDPMISTFLSARL